MPVKDTWSPIIQAYVLGMRLRQQREELAQRQLERQQLAEYRQQQLQQEEKDRQLRQKQIEAQIKQGEETTKSLLDLRRGQLELQKLQLDQAGRAMKMQGIEAREKLMDRLQSGQRRWPVGPEVTGQFQVEPGVPGLETLPEFGQGLERLPVSVPGFPEVAPVTPEETYTPTEYNQILAEKDTAQQAGNIAQAAIAAATRAREARTMEEIRQANRKELALFREGLGGAGAGGGKYRNVLPSILEGVRNLNITSEDPRVKDPEVYQHLFENNVLPLAKTTKKVITDELPVYREFINNSLRLMEAYKNPSRNMAKISALWDKLKESVASMSSKYPGMGRLTANEYEMLEAGGVKGLRNFMFTAATDEKMKLNLADFGSRVRSVLTELPEEQQSYILKKYQIGRQSIHPYGQRLMGMRE